MSRPRYYIIRGWSSKYHGMRWFACDGDNVKNEVLINYSFSEANDALTFCDYLNTSDS